MKKVLAGFIVVLVLGFMGEVFAAGSCVKSTVEKVNVANGKAFRQYITLTCTGDGTIAAYSFVPSTEGVKGWYLYNVTTDPDGTSAPTADYDITLVVGGEDIAGGKLANRSDTATQTVAIAPTTQGYYMADGTMVITFANETASPSIIVMKLRFTTE